MKEFKPKSFDSIDLSSGILCFPNGYTVAIDDRNGELNMTGTVDVYIWIKGMDKCRFMCGIDGEQLGDLMNNLSIGKALVGRNYSKSEIEKIRQFANSLSEIYGDYATTNLLKIINRAEIYKDNEKISDVHKKEVIDFLNVYKWTPKVNQTVLQFAGLN